MRAPTSRWPRGVALAVGGLVAAGVATVLLAVAGASWPAVVAGAAVPAGLGVASEVVKLAEERRQARERADRDSAEAARAHEAWQRRAAAALRAWPAPLVSEADPFALGVHRPDGQEGAGAGRPNEYVPRDVDAKAAEQERAAGVLLLIGDPCSGVTRTAWQTALADPTPRRVVAPVHGGGLREALTDLDVVSTLKGSYVLIWLDDVDRYDDGDLTAEVLGHCRKASSGLRVIATISSTTYGSWAARNPQLARAFGAHVEVRRLPLSTPELERAAAAYPGMDFSQGVAAPFTGISALLTKVVSGDDGCPHDPPGSNCPLARVVLDTAIAWPATGTPRPLTHEILADVAREALNLPTKPDRKHLDHALAWAAAPVREGPALLTIERGIDGLGTVTAHPKVVRIRSADTEPGPAVWTAALADATRAGDTETVGQIGFTAHTRGLYEISQSAWALIPSLDTSGAAYILRAGALGASEHRARSMIGPLERIVTLQEEKHGRDHLDVAAAACALGVAHRLLGDARRARDLSERALRIQERELGPNHPDVAATLACLGSADLALAQPARARGHLERALTIQERELGPDHLAVAATRVSLGVVWCELGQPARALDLFERAASVQEREYGPDHLTVAATVREVGNAWRELGEPARARELIERALRIEEGELGADHTVVAHTARYLGATWLELGQPARARDLIERALRIQTREFGPNRLEVASCLRPLGMVLGEMREHIRARDLIERALRIEERELGPNHLRVATTVGNLGTCLGKMGQPDRARDLFERALRIQERELGPSDARVAITLANLGRALNDLGEPDRARSFVERALTIFRTQLPPGHARTASVERLMRSLAPETIALDNGLFLDRGQDPDKRTQGNGPSETH